MVAPFVFHMKLHINLWSLLLSYGLPLKRCNLEYLVCGSCSSSLGEGRHLNWMSRNRHRQIMVAAGQCIPSSKQSAGAKKIPLPFMLHRTQILKGPLALSIAYLLLWGRLFWAIVCGFSRNWVIYDICNRSMCLEIPKAKRMQMVIVSLGFRGFFQLIFQSGWACLLSMFMFFFQSVLVFVFAIFPASLLHPRNCRQYPWRELKWQASYRSHRNCTVGRRWHLTMVAVPICTPTVKKTPELMLCGSLPGSQEEKLPQERDL